jgi:glycosyltransferase involved in cell wall biosynthesis
MLGRYPPPHGGLQTHLVALHCFLDERGVRCTGVNITRVPDTKIVGVHYPQSALGLLWLLLRLRYDIVHLHLGGTLTWRLLGLGLICSLIPGTRAVLTFHSGGYAASPEGRSVSPVSLPGFVLRRFDRVIGVNRELVALFRRVGVRPERVRLISPYESLAGRIRAPEAGSATLPATLREFMASHAPVLVTVGLLEPEYDLPLQVEAVGVLQRTFPRVGLVIIGSGSLERDLKSFVNTKSFAEHVLICGDVPHAAVLRAIADSDLLLRTTRYDGDSIAVREALDLGTPVVATDNGMRPEGVQVVPGADLPGLCGVIEQALRPDSLRRVQPQAPSGTNLDSVFRVYRELTEGA